MSKLILRCNYLKNAPHAHLVNYIQYIGTREGVEKVSDTTAQFPATAKQKDMIKDILNRIEDADRMHEYYDYLQNPTRENASEFITQALEYNLDITAKKKKYMDYLANRPRVEKTGTHGLFSDEGKPIVLSKVADEVANHKGVIWTNVISLRREDAVRLGYDSGSQWQELIRSRVQIFAENYKIDSTNLKWYAAFHNESHHPHVHLVIYSKNPAEGYLTKTGIENMKSVLAHDIFRQDFMHIYEKKNERRKELKDEAEDILQQFIKQMQNGICHNEKITEQMNLLAKRLQNTGGKKVYGYLKADVKAIVNEIVDTLAKEETVANCYESWKEYQNEVYHIYKDKIPKYLPFSEQKEFKSIKNMVIAEAVKLGNGHFYLDDAGSEEREEFVELTVIEMREQDELPDYEVDKIENEDTEEGWEDNLFWESSDGINLRERNLERENQEIENLNQKYYAEWTDIYREARGYLYGTEDSEPDMEAAYEIMKEEAENGNALAMHDVARMYKQGVHVEPDETKADEWYLKSFQVFHYSVQRAEKEKHRAYLEYRIGKLYQYGLGIEENFEKAAEWFGKAVNVEYKYAQYSLGTLYYHGKGVEQNYQKACRLFGLSHLQGNAYASYELAKMYEKGVGTEKNLELAEECYQVAFLAFLAMERKSKDDMLFYRIGAMYLSGKGTEKDETKARKYFEKSSEYGNLYAKYQLAKMYIRQEQTKLEGQQPLDYEKIKQAIEWLAMFAKKENVFAAYALGKLYADGKLLVKDIPKAMKYLQIATGQNHPYAEFLLGKIYLMEECKNVEMAVLYLKRAAGQAHEFAAYRLGKLYLDGIEVSKDIEQAIHYLTQSAKLDNPYAQYVIGKLYLIGNEVEQDKERAFYYLSRSAAQGNSYAAYFLEHWNDEYYPDAMLMATRLLRYLGNIFDDNSRNTRNGTGMITDKKLKKKIREKKIAQGYAKDDYVQQQSM